MIENTHSEVEVLGRLISLLAELDEEGRKRVLATVATYYRTDFTGIAPEPTIDSIQSKEQVHSASIPFSLQVDLSPKEFLRQKMPQTDVERLACLAYYLTHYRETPNFKTLDLSKLNTEAAQPKFSNAAKSAGNAMQYGYLAQSIKGHRQISLAGEEFVRALPDRDAARSAMALARPRKRKSNKKAS